MIDPETGLCEGCGRTRDEIASWYRIPEEERQKIMAALPDRMREAFAVESPFARQSDKAQ